MRSTTSIFARNEGFSLTEMMVVSVLVAIILAAAWLASATVTTAADSMMARNAAQTQGQQALERMTREIRQGRIIFDAAGQPNTVKSPITSTQLTFYADIDHDGLTERVTYNLTSAGLLQRSVARTTVVSPAPTDYGADSAPITLAQMTPGTSNLFTCYTADDPPVVTTDPTTVRAVQVTMNTIAKSGGSAATMPFSPTLVEVRAYGDGYQPW
jgi:prepilin-type N-terminal cleavage/methylation domain-containing protein